MPHALSFTIGATTITLSTTKGMLLDYVPNSAPETVETVTERATIYLYESSGANLQTLIRSIEAFFTQCRRRQGRQSGDRGYVNLQMASDAAAWRSEIVDGRLELKADVLRHWGTNAAEVVIAWERRNYWEGAQAELALTNRNGSGVTGGLNVRNHTDSGTGDDNFVDISGAAVAGAVPAPAIIEMQNGSGTSLSTTRFYLAHMAWGTPASFSHILEGESNLLTGTTTADANSSSGNFERVTWTGASVASTDRFAWTLSTALLDESDSDAFHLLVRFANQPVSGLYATVRIENSAGLELWQGAEVALSTDRLQSLGVVPLPPGVDIKSYDSLRLVVGIRAAATGQLDLDFVQLSPTDSLRLLRQAGGSWASNDWIVDDGVEEAVYLRNNSTSKRMGIFATYTRSVMLWPGRNQRLYLLFDEGAGMTISRTTKVKVSYRPRRLTV